MRLSTWLDLEGRTQTWVATQVGISRSVVNDWVHGRKVPSLENRRLITALSAGLVGVDDWPERTSR